MHREATHSHAKVYHLTAEYLENEKGSVQISICSTCTKIVDALCEHKKSTWQEEVDGTQKLICDLCGKDGT